MPHTEDAAWRTGEKKAVEKFAGYVVTARTGPLPIAFLPRLAAALLSDDTDRQPRTHPEARVIRKKFCGGIHPGLGFRFTRGQRTVEVLVCFICDDVGVVRGMTDKGKGLDYWPVDDLDQSAPLDLTVDDSALGRRNLLLLAVEAFPKDEALKELLRAELAGPARGDE